MTCSVIEWQFSLNLNILSGDMLLEVSKPPVSGKAECSKDDGTLRVCSSESKSQSGRSKPDSEWSQQHTEGEHSGSRSQIISPKSWGLNDLVALQQIFITDPGVFATEGLAKLIPQGWRFISGKLPWEGDEAHSRGTWCISYWNGLSWITAMEE